VAAEQTATPDPDLVKAIDDDEMARVRAGHGLDDKPRPGGLLGPLPRQNRADDEGGGHR
jgi:hypothetical protein